MRREQLANVGKMCLVEVRITTYEDVNVGEVCLEEVRIANYEDANVGECV